jgi:hypothetical protein
VIPFKNCAVGWFVFIQESSYKSKRLAIAKGLLKDFNRQLSGSMP